MDCTRTDLLLGLLEDELDDGERSSVESHLEGCADCRETVDAYRSTAGALHELEMPRPSDEARARAYAAVMQAMGQAEEDQGQPTSEAPQPEAPVEDAPRGQIIPFLRFVAAAAVMLVVASLFFNTGNDADMLGARSADPDAASLGDEVPPQAEMRDTLAPADPPSAGPAPDEAARAERQPVAEETEADVQRLTKSAELKQRELEKKASEFRVALEKQAAGGKAKTDSMRGFPGAGEFGRTKNEDKEQDEGAREKGEPPADAPTAPGNDPRYDAPPAAPEPVRPARESERERRAASGMDGALDEAATPDDDADDADGAPAESADSVMADAAAGRRQIGDAAKDATAESMKKTAPSRALSAWTVASINGRRMYVLRSGNRLSYRDLPAASKPLARAKQGFGQPGPNSPSGGRDGLFVPRVGVTVRSLSVNDPSVKLQASAAKPTDDLRVAEELLAILDTELTPPKGKKAKTRRAARKEEALSPDRRQAVVALLRALGERPKRDDSHARLDDLRRRLVRDHRGALNKLRSVRSLELEPAAEESGR